MFLVDQLEQASRVLAEAIVSAEITIHSACLRKVRVPASLAGPLPEQRRLLEDGYPLDSFIRRDGTGLHDGLTPRLVRESELRNAAVGNDSIAVQNDPQSEKRLDPRLRQKGRFILRRQRKEEFAGTRDGRVVNPQDTSAQ